MILSGKARLAGVLGWPVAHSLSPRLHGHWLERYGIDGAYLPLAVKPEDFETALAGLVAAGFAGFNVTVPHKEAAYDACDRLDETARRIAAVNTIVVEDGRLLGRNSDAYGFAENLRTGCPSWRPAAGPALVLGAGGAARAVVAALADLGVPEICLCNRTASRAVSLAATLGGGIQVIDWAERAAACSGLGLLVNTTSLGLSGHEPLALDLDALPPDALVTDIVYNPLETPLLAMARARGNPVVDGLGMLLHQAKPGFEAWFGVAPEVDDALRTFVLGG